MEIRPMRRADGERVAALHTAAAREFGASAYDGPQLARWAREDRSAEDYPIDDPASHIVVAVRDGVVAGFGEVVPGVEAVDADGELRAVYVDPDHARGGVGSALLAHLEGYAMGVGCGSLELHASLNAVGFYESAGYERSREAVHELDHEGRTVPFPVVVMRRSLEG